MTNYHLFNVGKLSQLDQQRFAPDGLPVQIDGKIFLKDKLKLSSVEISLNKIAPDTGMDFYHRHHDHEEVYLFLAGEGQMEIDGQLVDVEEGSAVCIKPEAKRSWWNTGKVDLYYIVIQAPVGGMKKQTIEDGELLDGKVPWGH